MTPQGQDKWDAHPSTMENYNIDDLSSGDETDDDERPRKAIPAWAQKSALKSALRRQYKTMRYVVATSDSLDKTYKSIILIKLLIIILINNFN